jgi:hypothetical protein
MASTLPFNPLKSLPGEKKLSRPETNTKPRELDIPQKTIARNMVFSETEVWAFYRMSSAQFDFESIDMKSALLHMSAEAYASLLNLKGESDPIHIFPFTLSTPLDPNVFLATSYNQAQALVNPQYDNIMKIQASVLKDANISLKDAYLGVLLGERKKFQKAATNSDEEQEESNLQDAKKAFVEGFKQGSKFLKENAKLFLGIYSEHVSDTEERNAAKREKVIQRALRHSILACEPLTRDEILLATKSLVHPGAPSIPPLEIDPGERVGSHQIAYEYAHLIDNSRNTCLVITQEYTKATLKKYVATFTVSQLPEVLEFPRMQPFAEVANYAVPNASIFARLAIVPNTVMGEAFSFVRQQHILEAEDLKKSDETIQEYGHAGVTELQKSNARLEMLMDENERVGAPWVRGSIHIRVYGDSYEELEEQFEILKQQYRSQNISLRWTRNNQLELFMSAFPGSSLYVGGITNNHVLSNQFTGYLGLNFAANIGDELKPNALRDSTAPRI